MKYFIALAFVVSSFVGSVAFAIPVDKCLNIAGDQEMIPVGYYQNGSNCFVVQGNANPLNISQVWGLTGAESKVVKPGSVITDENGFSVVCEIRTNPTGCIDLTGTSYYRNQMIKLGADLKALGWKGGLLGGWIR